MYSNLLAENPDIQGGSKNIRQTGQKNQVLMPHLSKSSKETHLPCEIYCNLFQTHTIPVRTIKGETKLGSMHFLWP